MQRDHDPLEEALRRLVAAGCLPDRAGQPALIQLHMTLDQLTGMPGAGVSGGTGPVAGDPAGPAPGGGWAGPGAAAAPGDDCDASIAPIVTGHVDPEILDRLAAMLLRPQPADPDQASSSPSQPGIPGAAGEPSREPDGAAAGAARCSAAGQLSLACARELVLRDVISLLSGPAGLAARLRTSHLTGPAASISLPLDVGTATDTIPAHLRRAVILRDKHCGFPGCQQPARSTTSSPDPKADPPDSTTSPSDAPSTTSSPSTGGAGN